MFQSIGSTIPMDITVQNRVNKTTGPVLHYRSSWMYQQKLRSGSPSPRWQAKGEIHATNYNAVYKRYRFSPAFANYDYYAPPPDKSYVGWAVKGILPGFNTEPDIPAFPSILIETSFAEAYNRFKDRSDPQICFAEYISEINNMGSLWLGTLGVITTFVKKLVKAKRKDLPGLWVEYSFAVSPLISDLELLFNAFKPQNALIRESKRMHTDSLLSGRGNNPSGLNPDTATYSWTGKAEYSCQCTILGYSAWHGDNTSGMSSIKHLLHLLSLDEKGSVLDSLWNLVPFSWAIDYFFHIGDAIKFMYPPSYVPPGVVVYSMRTKAEAQCQVTWNKFYVNYYTFNRSVHSPGQGVFELTRLNRVISSTQQEILMTQPPKGFFEVDAGLRQVSYLLGILFSSKNH